MDQPVQLTDYYTRPLFRYVTPELRSLLETGIELYVRHSQAANGLPDYSFIVFPVSKAYEGFLKQYLYDIDLIDKDTFNSRRFRIGRALNPDVSKNQRDEHWLYDDLAQACGPDVAKQLWETWLYCRNRVFHHFPKEAQPISLDKVERYLHMLFDSMENALECQAN